MASRTTITGWMMGVGATDFLAGAAAPGGDRVKCPHSALVPPPPPPTKRTMPRRAGRPEQLLVADRERALRHARERKSPPSWPALIMLEHAVSLPEERARRAGSSAAWMDAQKIAASRTAWYIARTMQRYLFDERKGLWRAAPDDHPSHRPRRRGQYKMQLLADLTARPAATRVTRTASESPLRADRTPGRKPKPSSPPTRHLAESAAVSHRLHSIDLFGIGSDSVSVPRRQPPDRFTLAAAPPATPPPRRALPRLSWATT